MDVTTARECGEEIAEAEARRRVRVIVDGIDLGAMAGAMIEDATETLKKGDPAGWPEWKTQKTHNGQSKAKACEDYRDAVYWFFYELDPMGERMFSLQWCCDALGPLTGTYLNADYVREGAARAGLMPKKLPVKA